MGPWMILTICLVASTAFLLPALAQEDEGTFQDYGDPPEVLDEDVPGQDPIPEDDVVGGDLVWKAGSYMHDFLLTVSSASGKYRVFKDDEEAQIMNRTQVVKLMETFYSDRLVYSQNLAPDSAVPSPREVKARADGRCYLGTQATKVRIADCVADFYMRCPPIPEPEA